MRDELELDSEKDAGSYDGELQWQFAIIGADCHGVGYCETETESPSSTNRDRVRPALAV